MTLIAPGACASVRCAVWGHKVHHTKIAEDSSTHCVRCGAAILPQDHSVSRVAHTLRCFFGWHHYIPVATRAAHNEYVCERCGHPLLFEHAHDPYSKRDQFKKRVNYGCGLLGHRVHVVEAGFKTTEYACRCGHSFVKAETGLTLIRHPLACVLLGHFLTINQIRDQWVEYVCFRCGHPFCFGLTSGDRLESDPEQRQHV